MSETQTPDDWRELYRNALQGFDPARIDDAQKAIRNRAVELWYAGSPATRERRELDAAIYFLNLFMLLGASEEKSSLQIQTSGEIYDA